MFIGRDVTGSKRMIGFRLSSYAAGSVAVGPVDDLVHIPKRMKTAIKVTKNHYHLFPKILKNKVNSIYRDEDRCHLWF